MTVVYDGGTTHLSVIARRLANALTHAKYAFCLTRPLKFFFSVTGKTDLFVNPVKYKLLFVSLGDVHRLRHGAVGAGTAAAAAGGAPRAAGAPGAALRAGRRARRLRLLAAVGPRQARAADYGAGQSLRRSRHVCYAAPPRHPLYNMLEIVIFL